jgi:aldehyde:ferredoxin oxidoreductase
LEVKSKTNIVEIKDATHLWGKPTAESQTMIRKELDDRRIRTAQIGPGGENMVRYACIINDLRHTAGRSGIGAVMGSKNLKAVACRGHHLPPIADRNAVREMQRWLLENYEERCGHCFGCGCQNQSRSRLNRFPAAWYNERQSITW